MPVLRQKRQTDSFSFQPRTSFSGSSTIIPRSPPNEPDEKKIRDDDDELNEFIRAFNRLLKEQLRLVKLILPSKRREVLHSFILLYETCRKQVINDLYQITDTFDKPARNFTIDFLGAQQLIQEMRITEDMTSEQNNDFDNSEKLDAVEEVADSVKNKIASWTGRFGDWINRGILRRSDSDLKDSISWAERNHGRIETGIGVMDEFVNIARRFV